MVDSSNVDFEALRLEIVHSHPLSFFSLYSPHFLLFTWGHSFLRGGDPVSTSRSFVHPFFESSQRFVLSTCKIMIHRVPTPLFENREWWRVSSIISILFVLHEM